MRIKIKYIIFLVLLGYLPIKAQSTGFQIINIENSLSNNYVRTVYKDSQGLIWFGTDTGLDSYDGLQIINYAKRFGIPLKGAVQSIAEWRKGVFLIGTSWGAFQYNIRKNEILPLQFGITSPDVRHVFISSERQIFLATDKGCYSLDSVSLKPHLIPFKNNLKNSFSAILEDSFKNILIFGKNNLKILSSNKKLVRQINLLPAGHDIITAKLLQKVIYLGTNRGLYACSADLKSTSLIQGTENLTVLSLETDNQNNLFIGTDNAGLLEMNVGKEKKVSAHHSSLFDKKEDQSISFYALHFDKSGILWAGTFDKGVHFRNLHPVKRFDTFTFQGSTNANIRSLFIDKNGHKFIGTRDGSLLHFNQYNQLFAQKRSISNNPFKSNILLTILPYPGKPDYLLIGTFGGGVSVVNKKNLTINNLNNSEFLYKGSIYKFCQDKFNQLWIATLDGLYRYNLTNQSVTKIETINTTGSNEVFTLSTDNKDKVWIGTKTGVCYYSFSKNKVSQPVVCKNYNFQCTSVLVDSKENIWFCFNKGGVLQIDKHLKNKNWITREIGLPENAPSSLVEDKDGNVWIGTSKGLYKVSVNGSVHAYGFEDGLTGIGFCPESATKDFAGNLYWTNDKGMVRLIDDKKGKNLIIPPVKLTDLYINGQRFDTDTLDFVEKINETTYNIEIKGKSNNNLEFRVAALNYNSASKNQYSFKLRGFDKNWSIPATYPIIALNHLSPGSYILMVKASNNDDIWTPVPTEIKFTIRPYFYETVWFLLIIVLSSVGIFLYFTRNYMVRLKSRLFNQIEDLRKKQAPATLKITEQKGNEISNSLMKYMSDEKPWLNPELRQADVATAIGYSVHEISQVLNVQLHQNFSDFINSYRVNEIKRRMATDDAKKYTLTAIAMQCGFSAKSSFLRAFKKATNMTPSDYFKSIQSI